jgi:hypothetical protein
MDSKRLDEIRRMHATKFLPDISQWWAVLGDVLAALDAARAASISRPTAFRIAKAAAFRGWERGADDVLEGRMATRLDGKPSAEEIEAMRAELADVVDGVIGPATELERATAELIAATLDAEEHGHVHRTQRREAACRDYRFAKIRADVAAGRPCPNANLLGWNDLPCEYCGKGHGPASRGERQP